MSELASAPSGAAPPQPAESPNEQVSGSRTAAGAVLAGRYRLRTMVGADITAGAEFWQAQDGVLQRPVAVTVLRRLAPESGGLGAEDPTTARAGEMVVRALRSGSFEHSGCARLLDVLTPGTPGIPDDVLGAAVTEWVPGRSLAEAVADGLIKPMTAARAVTSLAGAAEAAHRHGLVLGCDHPQRVRLTPDGRAQLCFAMPRPDLTPADDVRGLGAVLYTLLTGRWPLSGLDAAAGGLPAAERSPAGTVPAPSAQRPGVPVEFDALTAGTLGPHGAAGHVHTAAAVHRLLDEVVAEDDRVALLPPAHDGVPSAPDDVWQDGTVPAPPPDPERRRKLLIGLAALGVAVLLVLGFVGLQVGSLFADGGGGPRIVVGDTNGAVAGGGGTAPAGGGGGVAAAAGAEVYDPTGDRDNAGRVSRVLDGNRDSGWRTFVYRQQLPALKPGVGIMVSFASAEQLSDLVIDSPSAGTVIQVRSAPSAKAAFADTVPIAETTLKDGTTAVSLAGSQPVQHLLLWITKLGGGGGENVTQLDELQFARAGA